MWTAVIFFFFTYNFPLVPLGLYEKDNFIDKFFFSDLFFFFPPSKLKVSLEIVILCNTFDLLSGPVAWIVF